MLLSPLMFSLSSFLICAFKGLNFLPSIALAISYKFWHAFLLAFFKNHFSNSHLCDFEVYFLISKHMEYYFLFWKWRPRFNPGMATHSSILAWRILWTEEPGKLRVMESQRVRQDWAINTFTFVDYSIGLAQKFIEVFL